MVYECFKIYYYYIESIQSNYRFRYYLEENDVCGAFCRSFKLRWKQEMVDGRNSISIARYHRISIDVGILTSIDYEAIRELMTNQKISSFTKVLIFTSLVFGRLLGYLLGFCIILEAGLPRDFLDLIWRKQEATIERRELRIGEIDQYCKTEKILNSLAFSYSVAYFYCLFYLSIIQTIITMCFMNMSEQSLLLGLGFSIG